MVSGNNIKLIPQKVFKSIRNEILSLLKFFIPRTAQKHFSRTLESRVFRTNTSYKCDKLEEGKIFDKSALQKCHAFSALLTGKAKNVKLSQQQVPKMEFSLCEFGLMPLVENNLRFSFASWSEIFFFHRKTSVLSPLVYKYMYK